MTFSFNLYKNKYLITEFNKVYYFKIHFNLIKIKSLKVFSNIRITVNYLIIRQI